MCVCVCVCFVCILICVAFVCVSTWMCVRACVYARLSNIVHRHTWSPSLRIQKPEWKLQVFVCVLACLLNWMNDWMHGWVGWCSCWHCLSCLYDKQPSCTSATEQSWSPFQHQLSRWLVAGLEVSGCAPDSCQGSAYLVECKLPRLTHVHVYVHVYVCMYVCMSIGL